MDICVKLEVSTTFISGVIYINVAKKTKYNKLMDMYVKF